MDLVWVRDPDEGFILGNVSEWYADGAEVVPNDRKHHKRVCSFDDIHQAGDHAKEFNDNCEMMFLNEATLLNNVKLRYYKNKIYTYVANILIAVNPYKEIADMYSPKTIKSYQGRSLGELPPHVFAIADKALRDMRVLKKSQSIIVSGESGAGKTESTKHLLRYLCESWASSAGPIEQKILDANPVLEAFGNAKTTRNNNSSRFGKFIEVHFDKKFQVVGGHISHYLLEKSRICSPTGDERSYHVFYMLMAGAPESLRQSLFLTQPDNFNYLRNGCTQYFTNASTEKKLTQQQKSQSHRAKGPLKDTLLNDCDGFLNLDKALKNIGLTDGERMEIYAIVAAVLHLGNIEFEDNPEDTRGGCMMSLHSEKTLIIVSKLIGIDPGDLKQSLVSRVMQSARGGIKGTVIMVPLKVHEARNARDALAKALYSKLFDNIVSRINQSIPFQASSYYVGVLDIAGFEFFTVNSFEQFCINYCNEKLQEFFNETILKFEQDLYRREGLNVPEIKFVDNQDCIDIIETKNKGIFNLLDEESKLPKPNYAHFTAEVHSHWPNHFRLALPRSSRLKAHRSVRDDEGFIIRHFAGAVCYQTSQFIEKNNDALHASLESIVQESSSKLIKSLFAHLESQKGKLSFISVGSKFKTQLAELMEKLRSNGTNFIRCIKPNSQMIDQQFDGALSLMQLKCSGMTSVLQLMEHGFPSRTPFAELYSMYESFLPKELKSLAPRTFCEAMLHSLNLHERDYKFGVTRVFFRPGKFAEFDKIMKSDPENLKTIIKNVKKWLVRSRWMKSQFTALTVIKLKNKILYRRQALITVQKNVRGYLVKKKHGPRIKALRKIKGLDDQVKQLDSISSQLKKDKEISNREIMELKNEIRTAVNKIKRDDDSAKIAEFLYEQLMGKVNRQMTSLRKKVEEQKIAEEQERMKRIHEEMEREKLRKEAEARQLREDEENRKKKAEMEVRRKREEEEKRKQEEADRKAALELQMQVDKDNNKYQQQLEQERQDHELALRLAKENNENLEDSPPAVRNGGFEQSRNMQRGIRSDALKNQSANKQKYDLSRWKYSELRDAINTSCDIELLEACRHEFHRRLKVYHAWKAKNRKKNNTGSEENERAPRSIMESAQNTLPMHVKHSKSDNAQRYFRIPFTRPATIQNNIPNDTGKKGWWFAHFDGEYVARQMELHPEKAAVLLVAGRDDMQMCELSLEETGLTRKRGAEILQTEFDREWQKYGGEIYLRPADRKQ